MPPASSLAVHELSVDPSLRVRDNMVFFGELAGLRGRLLEERIAAVRGTFAVTHCRCSNRLKSYAWPRSAVCTWR
jgi:ABC-type Na+ transport system ATPase subunit NatA